MTTTKMGRNRSLILKQALASAKTDGRPRFVHIHNFRYYLGKTPPFGAMAAGVYTVVWPSGVMEERETTLTCPEEFRALLPEGG
jgi:hypothetical protein